MAKRASEKLDSIGDTDFQAVFKRIFKVDIRDDTQFYTPIDAPPPAPGRKAFTIVYGTNESLYMKRSADLSRRLERDWHAVYGDQRPAER